MIKVDPAVIRVDRKKQEREKEEKGHKPQEKRGEAIPAPNSEGNFIEIENRPEKRAGERAEPKNIQKPKKVSPRELGPERNPMPDPVIPLFRFRVKRHPVD